MNPLACTRAIQPAVNKLGSGFMLDGASFARASEIGLEPGLGFYIIGRFGALGKVHHDVISASAAFFAPEAVAGYWDDAIAKADPTVAATLFVDCADAWGRAHLAQADGLDRLNELATQVVDSVTPAAASLFVGLRAMPRSADPAGLCTQLSFCMRELRMARHVVAVVAEGISPLEAILTGSGGEGNAKLFGWQPPFPDVSALHDRRAAAEANTDEIHARDLVCLSDAERSELAEGYAAVLASIG